MSVTYAGHVGEHSEKEIWKRVPNPNKKKNNPKKKATVRGKPKSKLKKARKQATHHSNLVCSICKKRIRKTDPSKYAFKMRMKRLREHRKKYHPSAFKKSIKKGVKTRKEKR